MHIRIQSHGRSFPLEDRGFNPAPAEKRSSTQERTKTPLSFAAVCFLITPTHKMTLILRIFGSLSKAMFQYSSAAAVLKHSSECRTGESEQKYTMYASQLRRAVSRNSLNEYQGFKATTSRLPNTMAASASFPTVMSQNEHGKWSSRQKRGHRSAKYSAPQAIRFDSRSLAAGCQAAAWTSSFLSARCLRRFPTDWRSLQMPMNPIMQSDA